MECVGLFSNLFPAFQPVIVAGYKVTGLAAQGADLLNIPNLTPKNETGLRIIKCIEPPLSFLDDDGSIAGVVPAFIRQYTIKIASRQNILPAIPINIVRGHRK